VSKDTAPVPTAKTVFEERYAVDIKQPLADFSTGGGEAYLCKDNENPSKPLYALVHSRGVPIRARAYNTLSKNNIPNVISPIARGLMTLQLSGGEQRMVTIFERPTGGILMGADGKILAGLTPTRIRQIVVASIVKGLAALHAKGVVHRSVLPTRMYLSEPGSDTVVLGECISAPPGLQVPSTFEPLELCFSEGSARGSGTHLTDFFQFGVALASLYIGQPIWQGRDSAGFIVSRVNQGSYWALMGGRDITGALGNLVRGLMADMPQERWAAEDVIDWFDGLAKPKRATLKAFAMNRPASFKGVAIVDRRLLADAFNRNDKDAALYLRKQDFAAWAQTALRDEVLSERLESMLNVQPADNHGSMSAIEEARMVSRVCTFLDPSGPIRYKGMTVWIDALPSYLASIIARDERDKLSVLVELLDARHLQALADIAGKANPLLMTSVPELRSLINIVHDRGLGKGVERALYMLNPSLPCQSPRFSKVWVSTVKTLLQNLNRLAEAGGGKNILQDRHVAAFLAAHGGNLDREFSKLNAVQGDSSRFAVASVEFFGALQEKSGAGPLIALAGRLASSLGPAVKGLKNKKNRENVQSILEKVQKGGDISKLTSEVNLTKFQLQDQREFNAARTQVAKIDRDRARLSGKIQPNDPKAVQKGVNGARIFAFGCLAVTITLAVI